MGTTKRSHPSAVRPGSAIEAAEAFGRIRNDIEALPADRVGRVTADVPRAVSLALGALPLIESLLPDMADVFKRPPEAEVRRLRDRALALLYTHLLYTPPSKQLEADLEEARVLREQLLGAADAHVLFGHIDRESVAKIREGAGHLDRANDLIALAALFDSAWPVIGAQTPVKPAQIDRAAELGTALVAALGGKELDVGALEGGRTPADLRNRAFRLLITDYEEIRAAVQYLRRHEGDADAFAPSLHRRNRSSTGGSGTGATDAGNAGTNVPGDSGAGA